LNFKESIMKRNLIFISKKKFHRLFRPVLLSAGVVCAWMCTACGDGVVQVENVSYEPRVVIEAYLIPGKPVRGIRLYRNFRLDADLSKVGLFVDPQKTTVSITDDGSGQVYPLSFHTPDNLLELDGYYYEYPGTELTIRSGASYTLNVQTEIDGVPIQARSTTTVPQTGFHIQSINYDTLRYRQTENGKSVHFVLDIQRSPGTTYYLAAIHAQNPTYETLVQESPFGNKRTREEYEQDKDRLANTTIWIQNTPQTAGVSLMNLFWFNFHFYDTYRVVVYAADDNYRTFLQTYSRVQEIDGNFHEAQFNIEGQGIGVFGSVIPDTVYVTVIPE